MGRTVFSCAGVRRGTVDSVPVTGRASNISERFYPTAFWLALCVAMQMLIAHVNQKFFPYVRRGSMLELLH